jgi:hypothetical protein
MATKPARMSFSLYDGIGGGGTFLLHMLVDDGQTLAAANTALGTIAAALSTVSTAGIKNAQFSLINSAVAADPGSDADIAAGAVFDFADASLVPGTYGLLVPSFLDSLILPNGTIDITATVQAAFIASILAAVLGGGVTDAKYLDLVEATNAFRTSRKLRRRIRP